MSRTKPLLSIRRMVMCAVFVALYLVLSTYLSINLGAIKITFEALPAVICAVALGPIEGIAVGFLGEFLNQMLTFGFTPTTLLWVAPIVARVAIIGFCVKPLGRFESRTTGYILFLGICILAGLVHSLINTLAYYVDSKMLGYYSYYAVFGMLGFRLISSAISAVAIGAITVPLIKALKRARLIS